MSGTNDFKPFAVGAGSNVLTQADYLALAALSSGFESGVAQSAALNKVWRQSSIMAAVLAQMIVDQTGQNATDDGTTATLESNLVTAIKNISQPLLTGLIGSVRNASMNVTSASSSATFSADQIVVGTALNGLEYLLSSYSKTINLATTGAGGMDTGSAPVSGFVALYAIYNPTTQTASILATNATSTLAPTVYGGANMPAGYTASALISVWPTNSSGQLKQALQRDRRIDFSRVTAVSSTTAVTSLTAVTASSILPKNAVSCSGWLQVTCTASSSTAPAQNAETSVASDASGIGYQQFATANSSTNSLLYVGIFRDLPIETAQTFYWTSSADVGIFNSGSVQISGYNI